MPEENEVKDNEVLEQVEQSNVEAEEEAKVPVRVVKELRDELRESKRQAGELQKLAMQYANLLQQSQQTPKAAVPEVEVPPVVVGDNNKLALAEPEPRIPPELIILVVLLCTLYTFAKTPPFAVSR